MKHKDPKQHIRNVNEMIIKPIIQDDDFLRLNVLNYARSEFRNEATRLKPANSDPIDFTNIYNMSVAWDYVLKHLHTTIDLKEVAQINHIISMNNNEDITGGAFRYAMAYVLGQPAPNPVKVRDLLDSAVYKMNKDKNQILTKAFDIHYDIITIQPFSDFNKRTARIIMNWYLLQNDYTPVLFNHKGDNTQYVQALRNRLNGNVKSYTAYMCDRTIKTQHAILRMLNSRIH